MSNERIYLNNNVEAMVCYMVGDGLYELPVIGWAIDDEATPWPITSMGLYGEGCDSFAIFYPKSTLWTMIDKAEGKGKDTMCIALSEAME